MKNDFDFESLSYPALLVSLSTGQLCPKVTEKVHTHADIISNVKVLEKLG